MTFPTLTWTSTIERAVTIAGTNSTVAELLTAIKAAIDNDSAWWQTSDYNSGNGTLELKRKATPAGEFATVRIMLFGGASPNAAAMTSGAAAATTTLYGCLSVDANTTGPAASYTTGAPYSTKFCRGEPVILTGSMLVGASSPRVCLVESSDGLAICLHDTAGVATFMAGYLFEDVQNATMHWGVMGSWGKYTNITSDSGPNTQAATFMIPTVYAAGGQGGNYWNSVVASNRRTGRINGLVSTVSDPVAGANGSASSFMPLMIVDGVQTTGATWAFLGYLRQIRFGPKAQNLQTLRNSLGVQQGILLGVPMTLTGYGAWFDQVY